MSEVVASVAFPSLTPARPSPEAEAAGRAAGYAAGRRAAEAELDALRELAERDAEERRELAHARVEEAMAALAAAADEFAGRAAPALAAFDRALLAAAVDIAEAVLQRELADPTAAALDAVRRVLSADDPSRVRRVHLNPADVELIADLAEPPVEVVADPAIARGDAVAELTHGSMDARIGTAVARVRAALAMQQDGGAG